VALRHQLWLDMPLSLWKFWQVGRNRQFWDVLSNVRFGSQAALHKPTTLMSAIERIGLAPV